MMKNIFLILLPVFLFFGCGGYDKDQLDEPNYIEIVTNSEYLVVGGDVQYTAVGHYDDNRTKDLSAKVYWSSDKSDILSLDQTGMVHGKKKGFDTISVSWNNMVSSKKSVEVKAFDRLVFDYPYIEKSVGQTHQNALSIVYDDLDFDKGVDLAMFTWTSTNPDVASVDDYGLITANSIGEAKITASVGDINRSMKIIVKEMPVSYIEIITYTTTVLKGLHEQYRAFAHYCDGSKKEITYDVTWKSSDVEIASVDVGGIISTYKNGTVTISAIYDDIIASEKLIVNDIPLTRLYISNPVYKITKGYYETFYVIGFFQDGRSQEMRFDLIWDTDNHNIIKADADGTVFGVNVGNANLVVSVGNVKAVRNLEVVDVALESINIIPDYSYVPVGFTLGYRAEATFRDGRISYFDYLGVWDILGEDIATVDFSGVVTAHKDGKVIIDFIYDKKITKDVISVTP